MKKLYTLLALFIFISTSLSATETKKKKNLFEGFVITSTGDSLLGEIQFVNPVYNELKVRFYNKKGKRTIFKPRDIVEYAFKSPNLDAKTNRKVLKWVHYFRKRIDVAPLENGFNIETIFLQRVTSGKINLYNYYTLAVSKINHRVYNHEYFVEPGGLQNDNDEKISGLVPVNRNNFRAYYKEFLEENDDLAKKIGDERYGYKHFAKIIRLHNG